MSGHHDVSIPLQNVPHSFQERVQYILHILCDASEKAITAFAYLHAVHEENRHYVGFVIGKSKVAPPHGHTFPRFELCSALLAIEIYPLVNEI